MIRRKIWFVLQKEGSMEKLLRCSDFGFDCSFEACEDSPDEAFKTAVEHARVLHGMKDLSPKDRLKARAAVQDAFCVPKGGYRRLP